MAEHKMQVLNGVRYRPEDLPEDSKGSKADKDRVVENPRSGTAQVIKTPTRRGATPAPTEE